MDLQSMSRLKNASAGHLGVRGIQRGFHFIMEGRGMHRKALFPMLLVVWGTWAPMSAQTLIQRIAQEYDRRFEWAKAYTFVWEIEIQTQSRPEDLVPPKATSSDAKRLRDALTQIPSHTSTKLQITITRHPKLSEIRIQHRSGYWHSKIPNTIYLYQGRDYLITWDGVLEPEPSRSVEKLTVFSIPKQSDLLFDRSEITGYLEKLSPAYLALSNPLKPWYFCDSIPFLQTGKRIADGFQFEGATALQRHTLQLDQVGLFKQYRLETSRYTLTHRVLKTRKVEGFLVPAEVEVREDASSYRGRIVARLLKATPTVGVPAFAYNRGAFLTDLRLLPKGECKDLERSRSLHLATSYLWEGSLWSEEDLKRIVTSGGSTLPPGPPRRRYSLVMFAPAVILLLIAGYLFWKSRKK